LGRPLLIMPAIESGEATFPGPYNGHSNSYFFSQDFPGTQSFPAPALVTQVLDLVSRYLFDSGHPGYAIDVSPGYDGHLVLPGWQRL
jgi:hypothetical protein